MSILDTGVKDVRNVLRYTIGKGAIAELPAQLMTLRARQDDGAVIFFVDEFFRGQTDTLDRLGCEKSDEMLFVSTIDEPTTDYIDEQVKLLQEKGYAKPVVIVGVGGGITMDVAKAVAAQLERVDGLAQAGLARVEDRLSP